MGIGADVVKAIREVNPFIGSNADERINDHIAEEFNQQTEDLWDAIGNAIAGGGVEYRRAFIYDGSQKASNDSEFHSNHFIPEAEMHDETGTSAYESVRQYEYNTDVFANVPVHRRQDEDGAGDPPSDELTEIRDGYRLIIKDTKVKETSFILPSLKMMPKNSETDIKQSYIYFNPGDYNVILTKNGLFQLFVENKGCYFLDYIIFNGEVNKDDRPVAISVD